MSAANNNNILDLLPKLSIPECEIIYNLGETLLYDDRGDIGFFTYRKRKNHYYNGKKSEDHPSPVHHWQLGALLVLFSEIAGLLAIAREMKKPPVEEEKIITYLDNTYL
jgi:hypothetical protein